MLESLNLFKAVLQYHWLKNSEIILFFNKKDLFEEKLKKKSINVCFSEYTGDRSYTDSIEYIKKQFNKLNKDSERKIFSICDMATNTERMRSLFNLLKNKILIKNLNRPVVISFRDRIIGDY